MNGLKLTKGKTAYKPLKFNIANWQELQEYISEYFQEKGYAIAYLDYKVLIGKVTEGKLVFYQGETFDPKFIVKIRIFDTQKELLLWRDSEYEFSARMRIDGEGDNGYFIEAGQVLWGNPREAGDNWTLLKESRGTEIYLPYKLKKPDSKWVKIKTRNYIDYNEIGQAGYVDCRFVDFDEGGYR